MAKKKNIEFNAFVEQINRLEIQKLYRNLAIIRDLMNKSISHIGNIDTADNLAEASFKAGRAYDPLDAAMDKLVEILDKMREDNNFDHYEDFIEG